MTLAKPAFVLLAIVLVAATLMSALASMSAGPAAQGIDDAIRSSRSASSAATDTLTLESETSASEAVYSLRSMDLTLTELDSGYMVDGWTKQLVEQSLAILSSMEWTQMSMPSGFPGANDFCRNFFDIEGLSDDPCEWIFERGGKDDGTVAYRIRLMNSDLKLAEYEINEVYLQDFPELTETISTNPVYANTKTGWISYVKVAEFLRRAGMGGALWELGNKLMKNVANGDAVGIFADATSFKWGTEILSRAADAGSISEIVKTAQYTWLYLVR